jgi:nitrogen fixation protein FixH
VIIWAATHDPSFAIEPDYYRKAVAWDARLAQERANAALGWTATATLARASARARAAIVLSLRDAGGQAVRGARVRVTAIHNRDGAHPVVASLAERADGAYDAQLPLAHVGLWEVRVDAMRGAQRFSASLRADLPPR